MKSSIYPRIIIHVALIGTLVLFCGDAFGGLKNILFGGSKPKIAVISASDFVPDRTQVGKVVGFPDVLADRIIEHLAKTKRLVPVERQALRRVILGQRFGQDLRKTYLDRTLDKAIDVMEQIKGGNRVSGAKTNVSMGGGLGPVSAKGGISTKSAVEPKPVGKGISEGTGSIGTTGVLADYNDILKDFLDLGTAVKADYLVFGNLEKLSRKTEQIAVPYSKEGKKLSKNVVDARVRLRIIDIKTGTVIGAESFRTKLKETVFEGKKMQSDEFTIYDHLGRLAAVKILDVTFPARVVNVNPLVISRGTNDGVKKGDLYTIEREGKKIKDKKGVTIARLKEELGVVKVVKTQDTISIVSPVSGEGFAKGDLASLNIEATQSSLREATPLPLRRVVSATPQERKALPRIAVGLIRSGSTAAEKRKSLSAFTDSIISRLTQTKRFRVMDRQEVDQLLTEQLAQAIEQGRDLKSAMGTLKGADYLLYGSVSVFEISTEKVKLPHSKRVFEKKVGKVEGNIRIVETQSGEIKESRKIAVKKELKASSSKRALVSHLADAFAEETVGILMRAIYPIKIVAIGQDDTIYINRGEDGGLQKGEILKAYRPGKDIIDPDSGTRLGREELFEGEVAINEVEDARSKGAQVSGQPLQAGDILKSVKGKMVAALLPKRSGARLPVSGVPFTKGRSRKATLAVGTFRIARGAKTGAITKENLPTLTNEFIVKLTNTNCFQVMERQEVDKLLDEKAFLAAATQEDIKNSLRQLKGADYVIYGEISTFYIKTKQVKVPYFDEIQTKVSSVGEGTLRIVKVSTGEVVAGDKVHVEFHTRGKSRDIAEIRNQLIDRFTSKAVSGIVGRIFPIKLIGIAADGTLYLNRGRDGKLTPGMVFNLMRPGKKMKDPDTGLYFGAAESKIGMVKIFSVEPFRSRARMVSGQNPLVGDILRAVVEKPGRAKNKNQVMKPNW